MNKIELIKRLVEAETETLPLGFEEDPMGFILKKYPGLNNVMEYMMTKEFREFVDAIFVVAPKPTTFKVLLHNGQYFFLQFMGDTYQATVLGKNYYLKSIGEKERCMLAIARLLRYGTPLKTKGPEGGETGTGEEAGGLGGETTPAETGGEETGGEEAGGEALEESKIVELLLRESIMEAPKKSKKRAEPQEEDDQTNYIRSLFKKVDVTVSKASKPSGWYEVQVTGIKGTGKDARAQRYAIADELANKLKTVESLKSDNGSPYIKITRGKKEIYVWIKGYTPGSTGTDVKEGLTLLFYKSGLKNPITEDNFDKTITALKKHLKMYGLSDNDRKLATEYLENVTFDKKSQKMLNQPLSQALAIKEAYKSALLTRSGIYDEIRLFAEQTLGINKDKWCPADLFVIMEGKLDILKDKFDAIKLGVKNGTIDQVAFQEKINNLFNDGWGNKGKPITGVSLKFEHAQMGKAKSYLEKWKDLKDQYNLTPKELQFEPKDYKRGIIKLREQIASHIKARGSKPPIIKYDLTDTPVEEGKLRGKYTGLKTLNFFFNQIATEEGEDQIDEALVALVAFAMSLSEVSPTFYKVTGMEDGSVGNITPFERGTSLSLDEDVDQPVTIKDSPEYAGIKILMKLSLSDQKSSIQISVKNNGNTQGTIELEKGPKSV